jgi:N-acetylglucosaminyl-diphospho-decaprenol L-rhamnosyltransferase
LNGKIMDRPVKMPELSIIYVNWNASPLLKTSIAALQEAITIVDYDIWVVDNASTDDSAAFFPEVHLIQNKNNTGFARANNQAMKLAEGRYFLLINTDAFAAPKAINHLYQLAEQQPGAGIIGARLVNPDGSFQGSYVDFPNLLQEFLILSGLGRLFYGPWYPNHAPVQGETAKKVDYVQGACMLVRRQAYETVGGLDEGYFMYSEEVDWCWAMQTAGWEVWYQPAACITHIGGASSRTRAIQREADLYVSRVRYYRKNHSFVTARLLEAMILCMAGLKYVLHTLLQKLNHRRFQRMTVSPVLLMNQMRKINL